ncbi:hypothetical protein ACP0HM_21485 [Escherichia coli]
MELLDNGNLGARKKLTRARNELLSLAAQSPDQSPGYARTAGRYADVQSERQRRES